MLPEPSSSCPAAGTRVRCTCRADLCLSRGLFGQSALWGSGAAAAYGKVKGSLEVLAADTRCDDVHRHRKLLEVPAQPKVRPGWCARDTRRLCTPDPCGAATHHVLFLFASASSKTCSKYLLSCCSALLFAFGCFMSRFSASSTRERKSFLRALSASACSAAKRCLAAGSAFWRDAALDKGSAALSAAVSVSIVRAASIFSRATPASAISFFFAAASALRASRPPPMAGQSVPALRGCARRGRTERRIPGRRTRQARNSGSLAPARFRWLPPRGVVQ